MEKQEHVSATSEAHQAYCCDICGDEGVRAAIFTCTGCNAREHLYCMRIITLEYPEIWFCDDCKSTNAKLSAKLGSKEEIAEEPVAKTCEKLPNNSRQIRGYGKKIISGKTRFLSAEEVIGLTSGANTCVSPVKLVYSSPLPRKKVVTARKSTLIKAIDISSKSPKLLVKQNLPLTPPASQHRKSSTPQPVPLSSKGLRGTNVTVVPLENLMPEHCQPPSNDITRCSEDLRQTPCKEHRQKIQLKDVKGDIVEVKLEKEISVSDFVPASVLQCHEIMRERSQPSSNDRTHCLKERHQTPCKEHRQKIQPKDVKGDTVEKGKCVSDSVSASGCQCHEIMREHYQPSSNYHIQCLKDLHLTPCEEQRQKIHSKNVSGDTVEINLEKEICVPDVVSTSVVDCHEIMHERNQPTSNDHTHYSKDFCQTPCKEQRLNILPKDIQGDAAEIKLEKEICAPDVVSASVVHCHEIVGSGSGALHDLELETTAASLNNFVDPSSEASWKGIFYVTTASGIRDISDEIQAHPPRRVHKKVYDLSKLMPDVLQFELVPRMDLWEDVSQHLCLDKRDIGLYLFPTDTERWEAHQKLLKHMEAKDLVMRTTVESMELLVFSSTILRMDCQKWKDRSFLWGVFKKERAKEASPVFTLQYDSEMNDTEVDMDIDMIGGEDIGETEIAVSKELFYATSPDEMEDMEIDLIGGEAVGKMDIVIPKGSVNDTTVSPNDFLPPPGFESTQLL